MSRRRATAHAFSVISGFIIIPASLAGVLLAGPASAAPTAANPCAAQLTAASASTTSPSAASSAPASPTPSVSAASPTPAPSSASPTSSPSSASPTPTPSSSSPTPSPSSSSPSPSPSPSTSSADTLCLTVQALAASVQPSGQARYAIWVWLAGTVNGTAKVSIAAAPGKLTPSFTVCPATGGTSCSVALTAGQAVQLRAAVAVPKNAAGTHLTLTATGTSPQSTASATASGSVLVSSAAPASGAGTGTAGTGLTPSGVGAQLPGTTLPEGALPSARLPLLPSPVTDPSLAFPQVTPSPDPTPASTPVKVNEVSASFPLSTRLVGGQIIGLAVLAAAITIAVARFSIRKPRPQHSRDPD
jgi:DNA segregation ATPase FtsK/SpoIIIE, S-DNA-T family